MRDIILDANLEGTLLFNIDDLQNFCATLPDKRSSRGRIYTLPMLVSLIILAKLAGEDTPTGITAWMRQRSNQLWQLFDWKHQRMPCVNTIRTVMSEVLDASTLEKVLLDYLHQTYGGLTSRLVTMDGKTMRGTIPKGMTQGVHLLAVYLPEEGIVIKQVVVDTKENEISAATKALDGVPLKGRVVCADAMQTQRDLSIYINGQGGDYIWFVKNNQPSLRADVERFFQPAQHAAGWNIAELPRTIAQESCCGHGRVEMRRLTLMVDSEQFLDWPAVAQVFMLEREVTQMKSQRKTLERAYGITSCSPEQADASQLLAWTRQYWGIENGLHYRRDVSLNEDKTRISNAKMAAVMATLNNFVIGLTRKLGYDNLAEARRCFNFQINRQLCAL